MEKYFEKQVACNSRHNEKGNAHLTENRQIRVNIVSVQKKQALGFVNACD